MTEPPDPPPVPPGGEGDEDAIESPFDTGTVSYMKGGEVLTVEVEAPVVRPGRADLGLAGPFLNRLNELLRAIGTHVQARALGERGKLPQISGPAGIALSGLTAGSVVFHFTIGGVDEQLVMLTPSGEPGSAMEEAVTLLLELVAESSRQSEAELLERINALPARAPPSRLPC